VELAAVQEQVRDIPWMSPQQGAIVYRHVVDTKTEQILELGTAHGVSAAYMAAALDELGGDGKVVTLDKVGHGFDPAPLLRKLGLADRVEVVRRDDSSYNWYLKEVIAERSDSNGNCEPLYDFCYVDGAKQWTIDGLAVFLVEKLLKPGGWILLDDLEWSFASSPSNVAEPFPLSEAERREPNVRAVFDLILRQHPSFTEFRVQDGSWGWAHKAPDAPRRYEVTASRSLPGLAASATWKFGRWISTRRRARKSTVRPK
jgi:predicted O-methyltransferase YrrM